MKAFSDMECLGAITLLLVHLLVIGSTSSIVDVKGCYWSGTSPICDGKCREGETVAAESHKNDGNGCITGKKKFCCKNTDGVSQNGTETIYRPEKQLTNRTVANASSLNKDCYWVGIPPNCEGRCDVGDIVLNTSRSGNGSTCIVGKKKYCCKRSITPEASNTQMPTTVTTSSSKSVSEETTLATTVKAITKGQKFPKCYWSGDPPMCEGSCKVGEYVAATSPKGDGEKCESGRKKYCCPRRKVTQASDLVESVTQRGVVASVTSRNNVTVINSTSRPQQLWRRRPTSASPLNDTIKNNPTRIVTFKRRLVMTTSATPSLSTLTQISTSTLSTPGTSTTEASQTTLTVSSTLDTATALSTSTSPPTTVALKKFLPIQLPAVLPIPLIMRRPAISSDPKNATLSTMASSGVTSTMSTIPSSKKSIHTTTKLPSGTSDDDESDRK